VGIIDKLYVHALKGGKARWCKRCKEFQSGSGLPDLFWHNIPKRGKICIPNCHEITKFPLNVPNGRKIHMYSTWPYIDYFSLQDPPKFTQIGIFWFENKPSGNPGSAAICVWLCPWRHCIILRLDVSAKVPSRAPLLLYIQCWVSYPFPLTSIFPIPKVPNTL
jgi:hypothetical protein